METNAVAGIVAWAFEAMARMEGVENGAKALSVELNKKIQANTVTRKEIDEWLTAMEANLRAKQTAAEEFFVAARVLRTMLEKEGAS